MWNAWKKQTKKKDIVEENVEGKTDKMKKVEIMMEGEQEHPWEEEGEGPREGNHTEGLMEENSADGIEAQNRGSSEGEEQWD